MRSPSLRLLRSLVVSFGLLLPGACMSHRHVVGMGPTGSGEVVARQYYWLFGLIGVNDVDPQRMAPQLTSYLIETKYGFVDLLLSPFLFPLLATSRTVVIRT